MGNPTLWPPRKYDHLVHGHFTLTRTKAQSVILFKETINTAATLIRSPCYFGYFIPTRVKAHSAIFLFKKPFHTARVNTARFLWPVGDRITEFHCNAKRSKALDSFIVHRTLLKKEPFHSSNNAFAI